MRTARPLPVHPPSKPIPPPGTARSPLPGVRTPDELAAGRDRQLGPEQRRWEGRAGPALAACEPRRSRFALAASHLIFFLGANAVTRNDGVLSVRAGFVGRELTTVWPGGTAAWQVDEYDDGLFTHCLVASRREPS